MQTCRGSHTHTLVTDPNDKANIYVYGSGTSGGPSGRGARRLLRRGAGRGSEHRALQHRRHPGAARRAGEGDDRQPAAHLRRRRRPARSPGSSKGGDRGPGTQKIARDQPVPRHHGVPGSRPRGRRLLGQRHPARHLAIRCIPMRLDARRRQELRLLALGDVQQRRHQGDLHRRVGRRHAAALPRDRSARTGAPTPSSTSSIKQAAVHGLLQDAGGADRAGELRRAQRLADPGARARHHGAGAGIRAASRCSTSPTRRTRSRSRSSIAARSTRRADASAASGRPTGTTATSTARRSRAASTSSS